MLLKFNPLYSIQKETTGMFMLHNMYNSQTLLLKMHHENKVYMILMWHYCMFLLDTVRNEWRLHATGNAQARS